MTPLFRSKSVWITKRLLVDFPTWKPLDCHAVNGNLGTECNGFATLQEIGQTAPKGGYGWPQWTGPRRRAYMAWCAAQKLDPASDEANYGYLVVELKGPEKGAVAATAAATGLYNKVVAFESHFERAGVKNYTSRYRYAQDAEKAWNDAQTGGATTSPPEPPAPPAGPSVPTPPTTGTETPSPSAPWYVQALTYLLRALGALFGSRKE